MTKVGGLTRRTWPSVVTMWLQDGTFIMLLDRPDLRFWRHALDCSMTASLLPGSGSIFRFCLSGAAVCMTAHCATHSNEAFPSDFYVNKLVRSSPPSSHVTQTDRILSTSLLFTEGQAAVEWVRVATITSTISPLFLKRRGFPSPPTVHASCPSLPLRPTTTKKKNEHAPELHFHCV